jgi:hypothetical protein
MTTKQPAITPRAKITLRVWQPILDALNERSDAACIRRDGLITRALAKELPRIREELTVTNSPEARRYLEIKLKSLFAGMDGSSQISLALDPSVAQLLEEVCTEKNIPRECLLNRLLMLLGASTEFLHDHFFMIPDQPISPGNQVLVTQMGPDHVRTLVKNLQATQFDAATDDIDRAFAPLGRIATVVSDPLQPYRALLQKLYVECLECGTDSDGADKAPLRQSAYCFTPFGMPLEDDELIGLNCYLPDSAIERRGSAASKLSGKGKQK